ncbi:MAG: hypothetical protein WAN66_10710 [Limnoraphis robusta]|jgi:hypothetical protein|uniref:Uncharacterized protein n=2 Tax=Limnoraphis robusta TaxID=1118279 RepID=A0A0F5YHK6_9CYAN|nr:hypothetical protein [Limnoraphis robusta]KKD38238.1 hypothetical protein WN50_09920 [Limnoraphis robusta CS-951]MEA5500719.1 hypothetical protein [Limnoraphis robusta BA-68 BA1]MEA5520155.1 hypothetical protein [Limnoraphis robusta CCNP1315]MEA5543876.1 hypothetical protein [Limnoraphis robusta CCNP1324]
MLKPKAVIITNAGVYLVALYPALMGAIFSLGFDPVSQPEDLLEVEVNTGFNFFLSKIWFYSMATFPIVAALSIASAWSLYKIRARQSAIYMSFIPWINIILFIMTGLWVFGS